MAQPKAFKKFLALTLSLLDALRWPHSKCTVKGWATASLCWPKQGLARLLFVLDFLRHSQCAQLCFWPLLWTEVLWDVSLAEPPPNPKLLTMLWLEISSIQHGLCLLKAPIEQGGYCQVWCSLKEYTELGQINGWYYTSQNQLLVTPLIRVNTSWGLGLLCFKGIFYSACGWLSQRMPLLFGSVWEWDQSVPGRVFGGTHSGVGQLGTSTSVRTTSCRDLAQVPEVVWEAQLIRWGLIKDVLPVWHAN